MVIQKQDGVREMHCQQCWSQVYSNLNLCAGSMLCPAERKLSCIVLLVTFLKQEHAGTGPYRGFKSICHSTSMWGIL